MKYLFTFFIALSLFSKVNAQNIINWKPLPAQKSSGAQIVHLTKEGKAIAHLPFSRQFMISDAFYKSWTNLPFDKAPYHIDPIIEHFIFDENDNTYYFDDDRLYKLDNGSFKTIITAQISYIVDAAIANGNLYVLEYNKLQVFSLSNMKLLNSKKIPFETFVSLCIGKNNKNYAVYSLGTGYHIAQFNDDGSNYVEKVGLQTSKQKQKMYSLNTNEIVANNSINLMKSSNGGISWQEFAKLSNGETYEQFRVNENQEFLALVNGKIWVSKDKGQSWNKINVPEAYTAESFYLKAPNNDFFWISQHCNEKKAYLSSNEGKNWQLIENAPEPVILEMVISHDNDIISRSCKYFDEYKTAGSNEWKSLIINGNQSVIQIICSQTGAWIAHVEKEQKYYISINKGISWKPFQDFPEGIKTGKIYLSQHNDLVFLSGEAYYISGDNGKTWEKHEAIGLSINDEIKKVILIENYLFVEVVQNGVSTLMCYNPQKKITETLSTVNGFTIQKIHSNSLHQIYDKGICFIAQCSNGGTNVMRFFISSDLGKSFSLETLPTQKGDFSLIVDNANTLMLSNGRELFASNDSGSIWQSLNTNIDPNLIYRCLATDGQGRLYLGIDSEPIYTTLSPTIARISSLDVTTYFDKNNNCIRDKDEKVFKDAKIKVKSSNNITKSTDILGRTNFSLYSGTYYLSYIPSTPFKTCKSSYEIEVASSKSNIEIPIQVDSTQMVNKSDLAHIDSCAFLKINFSNLFLRRCFSNQYLFKVENEGFSDAYNTKIKINLDTFFILEKVDLPIISQTGQELILDLGTIKAGAIKHFKLFVKVDCEAQLGQLHCLEASISSLNECRIKNFTNHYRECRENNGSYDPNDKAAFVDGTKDVEHITAKQNLEYLVRFQNTGTDTAFTVVIRDPISPHLEIDSLDILLASHPYKWEIRNNILWVKFDNIMLPDSNVNEKASHGFVKFSIKPKSYVTLKNIISNSAGIYFDYNDPIITNEVLLNHKPKTISDKNINLSAIDFKVFPNPTDENISVLLASKEGLITELQIYGIEGRLMHQEKYRGQLHLVNISHLPKGVYIIKISSDGKVGNQKFIKL